jgi:N-acetylneuraminic acid mutarotase
MRPLHMLLVTILAVSAVGAAYVVPPGATQPNSIQSTAQATSAPTEAATVEVPADLTQGKWREGKTMPTPRSETAAAVLGDLIYVPGGFGDEKALEVYDPAADTWKTLKPMPDGRHHLMVAARKGLLYVFGGAQAGGWQSSDTAWVYDPAADAWSALAPMPEPRVAGAAVSLGDYLYIVGGTGGSQALLRYDPAGNTWTGLAALLEPREHVAAVALDGKIYALAGRWSGAAARTSIEIYDPATDTWTAGKDMNEARSGFGAAVIGGKIMAAGGEVFSTGGAKALTSVEVYDPQTQEWRFATPLPVGIHGNPVAAHQGRLFILGGSDLAAGIDNRGRVMIYTP